MENTDAAKKAAPDPKAKVRNRGDAIFPAGSKDVTDNKDHFPINDINQARNALSRCAQYGSCPPWYKGSLKSLQEKVKRAVKRKYPAIDVGGSEKKSKASYLSMLAAEESEGTRMDWSEYAYAATLQE